jgi:hypothetical protein
MTMTTLSWTRSYYGVTHLGELGDYRRVTVAVYENFAILQKFAKGSPYMESCYKTEEEAKQHGEAFVKGKE